MTLKIKEKIKQAPLFLFLKKGLKFFHRIIFLFYYPIYYLRVKKYKNIKKIVLTCVPPISFTNMGDHAQTIAIKKWLNDLYPGTFILEIDKNENIKFINILKKITNKDDLIIIQGGGNMGERGIWSETTRRLTIKSFPHNKIISMPQSFLFTNSDTGKKELQKSIEIYSKHRNLTLITRDSVSYKRTKEYFNKNEILLCPDVVLYLIKNDEINYFLEEGEDKRDNDVIFCLRKDEESIIPFNIKELIKKILKEENINIINFDTKVKKIFGTREDFFKKTLSLFQKSELVITDRLHGLIFSVLTKTPVIVFQTIDHKLDASMEWFRNTEYVYYMKDNYNKEDIKKVIGKLVNVKNKEKCTITLDHFENTWKSITKMPKIWEN